MPAVNEIYGGTYTLTIHDEDLVNDRDIRNTFFQGKNIETGKSFTSAVPSFEDRDKKRSLGAHDWSYRGYYWEQRYDAALKSWKGPLGDTR